MTATRPQRRVHRSSTSAASGSRRARPPAARRNRRRRCARRWARVTRTILPVGERDAIGRGLAAIGDRPRTVPASALAQSPPAPRRARSSPAAPRPRRRGRAPGRRVLDGEASRPPPALAMRWHAALDRDDRAGEQIDRAEEVGDEAVRRLLVDLLAARRSGRCGPRSSPRCACAMLIASSWSCVTMRKVMPTRCWMRDELEARLLAQLAVERGQRLVEQQQLRLLDERARQRHALLLAARKLLRLARAEARRA